MNEKNYDVRVLPFIGPTVVRLQYRDIFAKLTFNTITLLSFQLTCIILSHMTKYRYIGKIIMTCSMSKYNWSWVEWNFIKLSDIKISILVSSYLYMHFEVRMTFLHTSFHMKIYTHWTLWDTIKQRRDIVNWGRDFKNAPPIDIYGHVRFNIFNLLPAPTCSNLLEPSPTCKLLIKPALTY